MPVDFDKLVLGPAMAAFGRPVTFDPVKSQPGAPVFEVLGVFDNEHVEVEEIGGEVYHSTVQPTLGVKLSDFTVPPEQGDRPTIDGVVYEVQDPQPDGQGGAKLILKEVV